MSFKLTFNPFLGSLDYYKEASGGSNNYVEITYYDLRNLKGDEMLSPGTTYIVSEIPTPIYPEAEVYITAITNKDFAKKGIGKFYNPNYDAAYIYDPNGFYLYDSFVIWGGYVWINISGDTGNSLDDFNLTPVDWVLMIPNNVNDLHYGIRLDKVYNIAYDEIEFDFDNAYVSYRKQSKNNVICSLSYDTWYFYNGGNLTVNPLRCMQWGRYYTSPWSGISNVIIEESYANFLNYTGYTLVDIIIKQGSTVENIFADDNSTIYNIFLTNQSYLGSINLTGYSELASINLTNWAYVSNIDILSNSYLYEISVDGSTFNNSSFTNTYVESVDIRVDGQLSMTKNSGQYRNQLIVGTPVNI
jgi:hypothetical protein